MLFQSKSDLAGHVYSTGLVKVDKLYSLMLYEVSGFSISALMLQKYACA
jgi:hypothetical protein